MTPPRPKRRAARKRAERKRPTCPRKTAASSLSVFKFLEPRGGTAARQSRVIESPRFPSCSIPLTSKHTPVLYWPQTARLDPLYCYDRVNPFVSRRNRSLTVAAPISHERERVVSGIT